MCARGPVALWTRKNVFLFRRNVTSNYRRITRVHPHWSQINPPQPGRLHIHPHTYIICIETVSPWRPLQTILHPPLLNSSRQNPVQFIAELRSSSFSAPILTHGVRQIGSRLINFAFSVFHALMISSTQHACRT